MLKPDEEEEENNEEEEQQTTKAEPLEEKPPSPELPYKLREWDEGKGDDRCDVTRAFAVYWSTSHAWMNANVQWFLTFSTV